MSTLYRIIKTDLEAGELPFGPITITSDGESITGIYMADHKNGPIVEPDWILDADCSVINTASEQLSQYFSGALSAFDLPLKPAGTPFQLSVWRALLNIPYGETISYGQLAERLDNPKAVRAVGLANGKNPISIVVPCHRVIGANGKLVGYGGGLNRKAALLHLEQRGKELDFG